MGGQCGMVEPIPLRKPGGGHDYDDHNLPLKKSNNGRDLRSTEDGGGQQVTAMHRNTECMCNKTIWKQPNNMWTTRQHLIVCSISPPISRPQVDISII
jgi:hypothetical protein